MGTDTRMMFTTAEVNILTTTSSRLKFPPQVYHVIENMFLVFVIYVFISILFCLLKPYADCLACPRNRKSKSKFTKAIDESNSASYDDNPASNAAGRVRRTHKRIRERANLTMISLTLIMCSLVLTRVTIDLWAYLDDNSFSKRAQCTRHTVSGLLYLASAFCLYVFLWIRQRAFYAHPVLKHLARPGIVRFSWSVLVTIIAVILIATVSFFLPQIAPKTEEENTHLNNTILQNSTAPARINYARNGVVPIECGFQRKSVFLGVHFTITIAFLYFQISLQFLFGYPIFKQRRSRRSRNHDRNLGKTSKQISSSHSTPAKNISTSPNFFRLSSVPGRTLNYSCQNDSQETHINTTCKESHQLLGDVSSRSTSMFSSAPNLAQSVDDEILQNQILSRPSATNKHVIRKVEPHGQAAVSDTKTAFHKISSTITGISFRDIKLIPKSNSSATERGRKSLRRRMKLRKYVMRCLCVSFICSISDVFVFMFVYFAQSKNIPSQWVGLSAVSESMATSLAYNANIILNLLCMIACYKDWRHKLCPWYYIARNACHYQ